VFLGTQNWTCDDAQNILFLPGSPNITYKTIFLSACDVCVHARADGETFGLSVAECSRLGKPLITWAGAEGVPNEHLRIWGDQATLYRTTEELQTLLEAVPDDLERYRSKAEVYRHLYDRFLPQRVMLDFVTEFGILDELLGLH
jgi:glycosyltransferase involved in cell wall biosynthesis